MTTQHDIDEIRSIANELIAISAGGNLGTIGEKLESTINNIEKQMQLEKCACCSCKINECYTCYHDDSEYQEGMLFCLSVGVEKCKEVSDKCVSAYNEIVDTLKVLYPKPTVRESIEEAKEDKYAGVNFVNVLHQLQIQHFTCEDELEREQQYVRYAQMRAYMQRVSGKENSAGSSLEQLCKDSKVTDFLQACLHQCCLIGANIEAMGLISGALGVYPEEIELGKLPLAEDITRKINEMLELGLLEVESGILKAHK